MPNQSADKRRVFPFVRVLVQKAAARGTTARRGCSALDVLSQSRALHENVTNLTWWDQPGLKVYTPSPDFHAAHSLLTGQDAAYPVPDTARSRFPTVRWVQKQGTVTGLCCLPDGTPPVYELKILDSDPQGAASGAPWAFETADLGAWTGEVGAKAEGAFGLDRGVAVTLRLAESDGPAGDGGDGGPPAPDGSSPGDVRVTAGGLWSVLFRNNVPLAFEKKYRHKDAAGVAQEWVRLHTFGGGASLAARGGLTEYLVTFAVVAGALLVSAGGHKFAEEAYAYREPDPRQAGAFKRLTIPPAPLRVSGRAGGGARWVGVRRIGWRTGEFDRTLPLGGVHPADLQVEALGSQNPVGDAGLGVNYAFLGPATIRYHAQVRGTTDGRTTAALKWVWAHADGATAPGDSEYVDYGPAVLSWTEEMAEPDFAGGGGTRGSDGMVELEFSLPALALLNPDWRADLAPYAPATFVFGQVRASAGGTGETETESTRLVGYFWENVDRLSGFNDGQVRRTIRDAFVQIKEPGILVDTSYVSPLLAAAPAPDGQIYGWQAVAYYLRKALGDRAADGLRVYLPPDWYSLAYAVTSSDVTGRLPPGDLPLLNPPYGKYVAEALKEIAALDLAALYRAGDAWVYGHFDRIVAGTPTWDVYDGRGADGLPPAQELPDSVLAWTATEAEIEESSRVDFNRWLVWGDVPGGAGADAPADLGAPLLTADVRDFASIQATWERAKLFTGGQFHEQAQIERFARTVAALSQGHRAARHLHLTFPWGLPEVYWGHKMTLHGFRDLVDSDGRPVDGRTFRVYRMRHTGTMSAPRVRAVVSLIEMLE